MLWEIFGITVLALMGFVFVIYVGYYLYILRLLKNKSKRQMSTDFKPKITVIIPTYNEAETINNKLLNLIEQSYPTDLMETLLIDSDSKDETVNIAKKFMLSHPEVLMKIVVENERKGKSAAINRALSVIDPQSEIVIMTDANAFLERNALKKIVGCFSSSKIGAVVGRQIIPDIDRSKEALSETTYLNFYQKMREGESIIDSTPIFDGELSAYRTSVIKNRKIRENLNADDSQLAVIVRRQGYKAIMEPEAVFSEPLPTSRRSQRMLKVRRGQGLARLFWYNKDMMFQRLYGKFGFLVLPINFFMHVISPFMILGAIILSLIIIFYYVLQEEHLILLLILSLALAAWLIEQITPSKIKISRIALTFIQYQFLLLEGIMRYVMGNSLHKWQKVQKKDLRLKPG